MAAETTVVACSSELSIQPLTGHIGAEVTGPDLRGLDEDNITTIRDAFHEHQVLFFRGAPWSADQLFEFAGRFGEVHPPHAGLAIHPDNPALVQIKTKGGDGDGRYNQVWHSDVSFDPSPPSVSILQALKVPPYGGDTLFASSYAAYETLSEPIRSAIDGLKALHDGLPTFTPYLLDPGTANGKQRLATMRQESLTAVHPVVCRHPVTGRKALFVNRAFTVRILGLSDIESRNLLALLCDHAEQASLQVRWRWREGDIAMWDNRCAMHYASYDYGDDLRLLQRVTLTGTVPKQ